MVKLRHYMPFLLKLNFENKLIDDEIRYDLKLQTHPAKTLNSRPFEVYDADLGS